MFKFFSTFSRLSLKTVGSGDIPVDGFTRLVIIALVFAGNSWISTAFAQSVSNDSLQMEQTLYENNLLQIEITLVKSQPPDSLIDTLLSDAEEFARNGQWKEGREMLATILSLLLASEAPPRIFPEPEQSSSNEPATEDYSFSSSSYTRQPYFQVETGVDYSLQEFEMSFLESDSVIIDELQNPYFSMLFTQPFRIGHQNLILNHSLRFDNQFLNYGLFTTLENNSRSYLSRLEVDANYFLIQTADGTNFFDSNLSYLWGKPYAFSHRWYVNANSRFKWHPSPDSISTDILSADLSLFYEYLFGYGNSVSINITPSLYHESQASRYQYFQTRASGEYQYRRGYNRYLQLKTDYLYNDFSNVIGDSIYQNRFQDVEPFMKAEWAFTRRLGLAVSFQMEKRNYRVADAISPNINMIEIEALPRVYWGDLNSAGVGFFWQKQTHRAKTSAEDNDFVQQANFNARGLILSTEYIRLEGALINFEYRMSWRDYPHAQDNFLNTFYSNRFVHSLSLFGWIPLSKHWQIQLFANYDNDQDRQRENNDNRNTIVSGGLIYKF